MNGKQDNSDAMKYVKSLGDVVKRQFALEYLKWLRAGKSGSVPARGALSPALAKAVCFNLDALI